jgi:hypothetical protein
VNVMRGFREDGSHLKSATACCLFFLLSCLFFSFIPGLSLYLLGCNSHLFFLINGRASTVLNAPYNNSYRRPAQP